MYQEFNFDGLVGPTHHHAGLAFGNLASAAHRHAVAHPRAAARQGLEKMKVLADLGIPQAVLPPLERPSIRALRALGLEGRDDAAVLRRAAREAPTLLAACSSAASMWTANAATVAPSPDTPDRRLHLTPANLVSQLHRSFEAAETTAILRRIFANPKHFVVHPPLPGAVALRDEGAANHTRLTPTLDRPGLHLFVHGDASEGSGPTRFPARQARLAGEVIARRHGLPAPQVLHLQQHPAAIDAGVFHHDVIGVGHRGLLFHHQEAFADPAAVRRLTEAYAALHGEPLQRIEVLAEEISLATAVRTYLFNSQLVTRPDGSTLLVAPIECDEDPVVAAYLAALVATPHRGIDAVRTFDLRESMHNGGGPACLRQRIVLDAPERDALGGRVRLDAALYHELDAWIEVHYREELSHADLADPSLLEESRAALDALSGILQLGSVYPFQQDPSVCRNAS